MSNFPSALLFAVMAIGPAWSQAPPPKMQVEEPGDLSHPPIDPDQDSRRWEAGKSALSPREQAALEERRRQVESMALHVREARRALEQAGGKDREDRARALEHLILDRAANDDARKLEQLDKLLEKASEAKEKKIQKSLEKQEQKAGLIEKNLEKQVEQKEKQLKEKEKQLDQKDKQLEKELEKQIEKQEKEREKQDKAREKLEKEKTGKPVAG